MKSGKLPQDRPDLSEILRQVWLAQKGIGVLDFTRLPQIWSDVACIALSSMDGSGGTRETTQVIRISEEIQENNGREPDMNG